MTQAQNTLLVKLDELEVKTSRLPRSPFTTDQLKAVLGLLARTGAVCGLTFGLM